MEKKTKGKFTLTHAILIIGFGIVIALVCIFGYQMLQAQKPEETFANGALVIDESNLAEIKEEIARKEDDGMFELNMSTVWAFKDGTSPSYNAYLANGGANNFPITFEILLDGEVLYSSTLIPVGNKIKEIVLDKDLEAGTYAAVCQYTLWNEDGTQDSSFGVNVTLLIEG